MLKIFCLIMLFGLVACTEKTNEPHSPSVTEEKTCSITELPAFPSDEVIDEFYEAIFNRDLVKVKSMVAECYFPADFEPDAKTLPLKAVIRAESPEIFEFLAKAGADIYTSKENLLEIAAEQGQCKIIEYMVNNGADVKNTGALNKAGFYEHYSCAQYLLSVNANQDLGDIRGKLWILEQAIRRSDLTVLNQLALTPAEINANNCQGETSLIIAIKSDDIEMVKAVIKRGADKNKPETFDCGDDIAYGKTPREIAAETNNPDIIDLLK